MVSLKRIFLGLILIFSSSVVFAIVIDKPVIDGPQLEPINCPEGSSKYRPSQKNICDTEEKKCCGSGFLTYWADWGEDCSAGSSCTVNQCWNGSVCVDKPSGVCSCDNGTCSVSYTCNSGSGWQKKENCTCKSGYAKDYYTDKCVHESCLKDCSSGSYMRPKYNNAGQCECCRASCHMYHNGVGQFVTGFCDCLDALTPGIGPRTCCQHQGVGYIYTLPSSMSSCAEFGKKAFNENFWYSVGCPSKM